MTGEAARASELPTLVIDLAAPRILATLADAVVVADRIGKIAYWNEAAEELFGWSSTDALGRSLDLIIPERHRRRHWEGYERAMASGDTDYANRVLEVPALHRDGRRLSIAFTVTLVRDDRGDVHGIVAVVRDDTERWQEWRALCAEVDRLRSERDTVG